MELLTIVFLSLLNLAPTDDAAQECRYRGQVVKVEIPDTDLCTYCTCFGPGVFFSCSELQSCSSPPFEW